MPRKSDAHKDEYREWRKTDHGKDVYRLFKAEAIAIAERRYYQRDARFTRYSAQAIVYVIRYKREMRHGPEIEGYKIPNNFTRYLGAEVVAEGVVPHGFFPADDPEPKPEPSTVQEVLDV